MLLILLISYYPIKINILSSNLHANISLAGDILVAISILAVIACFGNFAFTYEKVDFKNKLQVLMGHLTTGLLMLIL